RYNADLHSFPTRRSSDLMKQYQCVVVGATREEISVAFSARPSRSVIGTLRIVTGCRVFPVLTEPARIRLLIHRIELYEQHGRALDRKSTRLNSSHLVISY